jgi:hypothetical protein
MAQVVENLPSKGKDVIHSIRSAANKKTRKKILLSCPKRGLSKSRSGLCVVFLIDKLIWGLPLDTGEFCLPSSESTGDSQEILIQWFQTKACDCFFSPPFFPFFLSSFKKHRKKKKYGSTSGHKSLLGEEKLAS